MVLRRPLESIQYASLDYRQVRAQADCTCSMSRRGPVESFFATLEMELVHGRGYETIQQARAEIFETKMATEMLSLAAYSTVRCGGGNPITTSDQHRCDVRHERPEPYRRGAKKERMTC